MRARRSSGREVRATQELVTLRLGVAISRTAAQVSRAEPARRARALAREVGTYSEFLRRSLQVLLVRRQVDRTEFARKPCQGRSEERRVGEEGRSRWSPY